MSGLGRWVAWVWALVAVSALIGTDNSQRSQTCNYVFRVEKDIVITLHKHNFTQGHSGAQHFTQVHSGAQNFTQQHPGKHNRTQENPGQHNRTQENPGQHYCVIQATADKHMRVVLDLVYWPPRPPGDPPSLDCSSDYVHVGNDMGRVDVDLVTSYKFCGEDVRHQLVSKGNQLWMVYRASQLPRDLFAKVWVQAAEVTCTLDEFRCSPVQCVDRSRMCDGVKDCSNGHDEFCRRETTETHVGFLAEPCFRCGDGTCILPRLSRYDDNYGWVLWYLCDGFSHCQDSWDEREDFCWHLSAGRTGSVVRCVPADLQFGLNGSVIMWNEVMCDSIPDCHHGEDEEGCNDRDSSESQLHADPATLGAVFGVLATACTVVCVVYRLKMARGAEARPSTSSTVDTKCTQMTSSDHDRPDVTSAGPTCGEAASINVDTKLQSFIRGHLKDDDDGYDDDDDDENDDDENVRRLNSLNLRQTIL